MGVMRNLRILSTIAVLLGMLAAGALPGVARAHHEPTILFDAATATTTPTINGLIGPGEWDDTPSYAVNFGGNSGTVMFKHDTDFLYAALTLTHDSIASKSMGIFFDDDHDGVKEPGEDTVLAFESPSFGADYYYASAGASGSAHYADTGNDGDNPGGGGTDDIVGAGAVVGPNVTFELRHPLCSTDDVHDFCLAPGDTVGLELMFVSGGIPSFYPGADPFVPNDWADLKISDAAPTDAGRIVFESTRDGNHEVYRMNADGSAQTRLTNNAGYDALPSISPDGTRVVFTSDREGGNLDSVRHEHRRQRRHAPDDAARCRPAAGLVTRRDEDRLFAPFHRGELRDRGPEHAHRCRDERQQHPQL